MPRYPIHSETSPHPGTARKHGGPDKQYTRWQLLRDACLRLLAVLLFAGLVQVIATWLAR
ncbi:hypothetical protein MRS76_24890 [Rhizobiaceae bacterium n13]|uniref:Uncharacterized protein n=1 Tax=Ferirhizobium litorale TaxID=2927786 RepID=A0AAE3QGU3_9HYPH|nr:hypothetical protein [Fererhizobium litorale]MDI7865150.1 hypothetical protein [Fererhizobium litorale]MDI7922878.1 hypothetical protein [Fererhizobium litorale]